MWPLKEAQSVDTRRTCSSPEGSRCFRPSSTARGALAARSDTGCSGGTRCATPCQQPIGRSGHTPAGYSQRRLLAPGWTRLSGPEAHGWTGVGLKQAKLQTKSSPPSGPAAVQPLSPSHRCLCVYLFTISAV